MTKTINCGSKAEIAQVVSTVEKSVRVRRAKINILPNISRGAFFGLLKDMAKIRHYSCAMVLILPRLKDITNFVLNLIECSR